MSAESIAWRWDLPDEHFTGEVVPPNRCANRYCPTGAKEHGHLVRGMCEPCASIRRPVVTADAWHALRAEANFEKDEERVSWGTIL